MSIFFCHRQQQYRTDLSVLVIGNKLDGQHDGILFTCADRLCSIIILFLDYQKIINT